MSKIHIGDRGSRRVNVDLEVLLRTRLLLQANSGGGKSWALRRLIEQAFGKVQIICIDPEGEFLTLREKYGFVLVGKDGETPADVRSARLLAERLLELRASAVCDLYEAFRSKPKDRRAWVAAFLGGLVDAPKKLWHPVLVVVDEAHKFCPQETPKAGSQEERKVIADCKEAMISLSTTGRKRAFCAVWATQRLAKLDKDASSELLNRIVGLTFEDVDIDRAVDLLSVSREDRAEFKKNIRTLEPGNFYAIGRAITTERILFKSGPVETTHPDIGSQKHAAKPPLPPAKVKELLPQLADLPAEVEQKAKSESEMRKEIRDLNAKIRDLERASKQAQPAPAVLDKAEMQKQIAAAVGTDRQQTVEMLTARFQKQVDGWAEELRMRFGRALKIIGKELEELQGVPFVGANVPRLKPDTGGVLARPVPKKLPAKVAAPRPDAPAMAAPQRPAAVTGTAAARPAENGEASADNGDPGKTPRQMIAALVVWKDRGLSRQQLAAQVSIKPKGSSMRTYLSTLRSGNWIRESAGRFYPSDQAVAQYTDLVPEAPTTTEEVLALWKPKVGKTPAQILDIVVEAAGDAVTKEDVAQRIGIEARGSSMRTYLSTLRSAGLIVSSGGDAIAANKETLLL